MALQHSPTEAHDLRVENETTTAFFDPLLHLPRVAVAGHPARNLLVAPVRVLGHPLEFQEIPPGNRALGSQKLGDLLRFGSDAIFYLHSDASEYSIHYY